MKTLSCLSDVFAYMVEHLEESKSETVILKDWNNSLDEIECEVGGMSINGHPYVAVSNYTYPGFVFVADLDMLSYDSCFRLGVFNKCAKLDEIFCIELPDYLAPDVLKFLSRI